MRGRLLPAALAALALLEAAALPAAAAGSGGPGGASEAGGSSREDAPPGRLRRFLHDHGSHLLVSFGIFEIGALYHHGVGPSAGPLLFDEPPGIDRWARDQWSDPGSSHNFFESHALDVLLWGSPVALVALDWRDRSEMTRDLMGFVELHLTKSGATSLLKDIVGRERPELEFADPNALSPAEIQALRDDKDNRRSFPSGHASTSFGICSYLDRVVAREVAGRRAARAVSFAGLYGLAGYVSYTRIRDDKHYLTDIVAGGALGVALGRAYYRMNHREEYAGREDAPARARRPEWTIVPLAGRGGAGLAFRLTR